MASASTNNKRRVSDARLEMPNKTPRLEESVPELEVVDPDGDALFLVPSEEAGKSKLFRVSTKILSLASKAFAAMFNGRYLEGQALSVEEPPTIEFPEDMSEEFGSLVRILHHLKEQQIDAPEFDELFLVRLLKLAEKYDCVHAVKGQVSLWLRETMAETMAMPDDQDRPYKFEYLLAALTTSYLIQDVKSFQEISRSLLLTPPKISFVDAAPFNGCEMLPSQLWTLFSEQRSCLRLRFFASLARQSLRLLDRTISNVQSGQPLSFYMFRMDRRLLDKDMSYASLSTLVDCTTDCLRKDGLTVLSVKLGMETDRATAYEMADSLDKELHDVQGLCLKCITKGNFAHVQGVMCAHRRPRKDDAEEKASDDSDSSLGSSNET